MEWLVLAVYESKNCSGVVCLCVIFLKYPVQKMVLQYHPDLFVYHYINITIC